MLAEKITESYYSIKNPIIGGVCHGVLGLVNARDREGNLIISGRLMTGVTDKQIDELGINFTPKHPETELRKALRNSVSGCLGVKLIPSSSICLSVTPVIRRPDIIKLPSLSRALTNPRTPWQTPPIIGFLIL